jgi:hypothetical protein
MAYEIQAWLDEKGFQQLRLIDARSGATRLTWDASSQQGPALKSLFHELMLLSAASRVDLQTQAAVHDRKSAWHQRKTLPGARCVCAHRLIATIYR